MKKRRRQLLAGLLIHLAIKLGMLIGGGAATFKVIYRGAATFKEVKGRTR